MPKTVTRDHHNLRRNLKLNDNYISNDGGDEGISIDNDGIVTASSQIDIGVLSLTAGELDVSSGNFKIGAASALTLDTGGNLYLKGGGVSTAEFILNTAGVTSLVLKNPADTGDYVSLAVGAAGVTTIKTVDDEGATAHLDFAIDGNCTFQMAGSDPSLYIGGGGVNLIRFNPNDGGVGGGMTLYSILDQGDYSQIKTGTTGVTTFTTVDDDGEGADLIFNIDGKIDLTSVSGEDITLDSGDDIILDVDSASSGVFRFKASGTDRMYFNITTDANEIKLKGGTQAADYFTITTGAEGATTIATVDADTAVAHLTVVADGHVEFDGCAVGFDKLAGVFGTSQVLDDGNDSTDIDFRLSNKYELELTDIIAGAAASEFLNLIFPAVSGNFILVISQDGTGSRTIHPSAYIAYQSDGSTKATNAAFANGTDGELRWAGGSAPTLTTTADKADIVAIYWDADNQTAFAVMSQNF